MGDPSKGSLGVPQQRSLLNPPWSMYHLGFVGSEGLQQWQKNT